MAQLNETFNDISTLVSGLIDAVEYDETDAAEYSGTLSPDETEATIDVSGQSLTAVSYIFTPMCGQILWVESADTSEIVIGIGSGAATAIKFKLLVFEKFY